MNEDPEYEILKKFTLGETKAFETVFLYYYKELYYYGLAIAKDDEIVKDSIQNLYFKLWRNKGNLRNIKSVRSYLFQAVRNAIGDELQQQKKKLKRRGEQKPESVFSPEEVLIVEQNFIETRYLLLKAMNKLSRRQRQVIWLRFFEELDYENVSKIMRLNIQSVRNLMSRSFRNLKKYLVTDSAVFLSTDAND